MNDMNGNILAPVSAGSTLKQEAWNPIGPLSPYPMKEGTEP